MEIEERLVQTFYERLWNRHELDAMPQVLDPNIIFRGSLGDEKRGHQGFADYVNKVHAALADYHCVTEEVVIAPGKVFARMTFIGVHQSTFLGFAATGKVISWSGAARFLIRNELIYDIWVLGDLKTLEAQLAGSN